MKREECEKKIEKWKEEREKVFCPLRNDMCRLDCECLKHMIIDESFVPEFTTSGGYCTCHALTGSV